jgi:hypothetical protein
MCKCNQANTKETRSTRIVTWSVAAGLVLAVAVWAGLRPSYAEEIRVYKSPTCGCCSLWVEHLKENGFSVTVEKRKDLESLKTLLGVPPRFQSCHTAEVDGYIIEGHVPAADIERLLVERPAVRGLAVPGMPMGSPGMPGPRSDPYDVLSFDSAGHTAVFSHH